MVSKVNGGREGRPIGAYELAKAVEELGAGEILLNCIDCDGESNFCTFYKILSYIFILCIKTLFEVFLENGNRTHLVILFGGLRNHFLFNLQDFDLQNVF